jgi:hypothetical protein
MPTASAATRRPLPIILILGFGGLSTEDERRIAYQGFNDGSVYPHKQGENYIYEGFILRLIKTDFAYGDATNVVGYFERADRVRHDDDTLADVPEGLREYFREGKIVADPVMTRRLLQDPTRLAKTFWVFRYYDLGDRNFAEYGKALKRLIEIVRAFCTPVGGPVPKVNIVAHSMGGLIVREAVQSAYGPGEAAEAINKIVTLGTPHRGISFQVLRDLRWLPFLEAADELEQFNPATQDDPDNPRAYEKFGEAFPLERMLCVVGTDYRSYTVGISSLANRLFSVSGEFGANYNRSDGLVKQTNAMIDGAQRTFVHKCHGGGDSLMTARESFEVATRFFFGDLRVRVYLADAKVKRKLDMFGKSEIFFGLSIKPRRLDFDLFHQSEHAENCYGPFAKRDLSDKPVFAWAGPNRLIWEGYLNSSLRFDPDVVLRAEVYVGERDLHGFGFSDNLIFRKQYFVRALLTPQLTLEWHVDQNFQKKAADGQEMRFAKQEMTVVNGGWEFPIGDKNSFDGRLRVELDWIPEEGAPEPLAPGARFDLAPTESQQAMVIAKIVS